MIFYLYENGHTNLISSTTNSRIEKMHQDQNFNAFVLFNQVFVTCTKAPWFGCKAYELIFCFNYFSLINTRQMITLMSISHQVCSSTG